MSALSCDAQYPLHSHIRHMKFLPEALWFIRSRLSWWRRLSRSGWVAPRSPFLECRTCYHVPCHLICLISHHYTPSSSYLFISSPLSYHCVAFTSSLSPIGAFLLTKRSHCMWAHAQVNNSQPPGAEFEGRRFASGIFNCNCIWNLNFEFSVLAKVQQPRRPNDGYKCVSLCWFYCWLLRREFGSLAILAQEQLLAPFSSPVVIFARSPPGPCYVLVLVLGACKFTSSRCHDDAPAPSN